MKQSNSKVFLGRVLALVLALSLLAACAPPAEQLPETGGTPGTDYAPPTSDECQQLADIVQTSLGVGDDAVTVQEDALFQDYITNQSGTGCQVTVTGTGADFTNFTHFVEMSLALSGQLQTAGWTPDDAYVADSPTGTAFAMRQDDRLVIATVGWDPAPGVNCPTDQPISECQVAPEQMNYTIRLNMARQAG